METIRTSTHVGADGVLRLEVPVVNKNKDVRVLLLIQPDQATGSEGAPLNQEPIRVPAAGSWNVQPIEPFEPSTPGPSASEMLINDRR